MGFRKCKSFIALLLACMILLTYAVPVYAAEATTEESVGTSLYSVSTALTAFANNVVGANTNDKHSDSAGTDKDHKLYELSNAISSSGSDVGDAGAIVGYGDDSAGFVSYISANETKAVTTSSYGAYLNIGDDGHTYAYVRYGRLLTELGLDSTGNPANSTGAMRSICGMAMQAGLAISSFVPQFYDFVIDILDTLNPFRFLVNDTSVSGVLTDSGSGSTTVGTIDDAFSGSTSTAGITEGTVTADDIAGLESSTESILEPVTEFTTTIYVFVRQMGLLIMIPLFLVFLVAGILLNPKKEKSSKIRNFLIRMVFIVAGIPLMGIMYTSFLDSAKVSITVEMPSARVVACTFVDFENWVKTARLDPPSGVTLKSEGISSSEAQGEASSDSWRTVRETVYQVNYMTGLYGLSSSSGLGLTSSATSNGTAYDTNGSTWTSSGTWNTSWGTSTTNIEKKLMSLLSSYSDGSFYTASAWESNVNSSFTANYSTDLGSTASTNSASSNKKTVYQMYFDTDEVDDWMNRSAEDNGTIFDGSTSSGATVPDEAMWANMPWNIFQNGGNLGTGSNFSISSAEDDITYGVSTGKLGSKSNSSLTQWGDAINPSTLGGLSTVAMYNYLSSAFNESNIAVYSAKNTTSEYTRLQHYSVNIAGGSIGWIFMINCLACFVMFIIIGFIYCGGMLIDVIKKGFKMLGSIPGAMLGVMKSIAQVIVYFVGMIFEILVTMLLYSVVTELVLALSSLVETQVMGLLTSTSISITGGLLAQQTGVSLIEILAADSMWFKIGLVVVLIGMAFLCVGTVKLARVVLVAWSYCWLKVYRLITCRELLPVFDEWASELNSLNPWEDAAMDLEHLVESGQSALQAPAAGRCEAV